MSLINFGMDNIFAIRLGTYSTLLRDNKGLRGIVLWPATMVKDPLTIVIFLLQGQG